MNIHDVHQGIVKRKKRTRVGRGPGSGLGRTAGRGNKGQGQLAGWSQHPAFEGGQMPLARRVPKRGFNNMWAPKVFGVNVGDIDELFADGAEVTPEALREKHLARGVFDELKILGDGELSKKLTISAHRFSATALEKIKQAGGIAVVIPGPKPVVKNKSKSAVAGGKKK